MAFFIKSVTDEYLKKLDESKVKAAFDMLKVQFSPSRQKRMLTTIEIGFQAEFVEKLFDKVLGYIRFDEDNWNIKREHNSETSNERADAAIVIDSDESKTLAVIELKSTKTHSLQNVEQQVFNYFDQHPICRYAITSNFQMLRLYVDDNQDFEEFDIFDMVNSNRFDRFKLMYLYLNANFVFQNLPAKIREATIVREKAITDKLYSDYKNFRLALHTDLQKQNPKTDKFLLFKKTQKLIDRFLFVLFAEDKELLPPLTVSNCIKEWETTGRKQPLFEHFKNLFNDINKGNAQKNIFAFNGGLFAPDDVLDKMTVNLGNLAAHLDILQHYDFKSEIDVNVLGHIFEQSLNDMDEMKALSDGQTLDKSKTKRKKEGVFYTPQYITRYIVENTVGVLCRKKEQELGIIEGKTVTENQLKDYRQWLLSLTVIDPACGSGAFLNQALDFFIREHRKIDERMAGVKNSPVIYSDIVKVDFYDKILENNIFGVDLNEEAVEIAKLSLWLRTAKHGKKLSNLNDNIKVGNSLIDDPSVSDAAFKWNDAKNFKKIIDNGGFDVIIGNPPYVDIKALDSDIVRYLFKNYDTAENRINLYSIFIEKGYTLLKKGGFLSFINPNSILMNSSYSKIRQMLLADVTKVIKLPDNVFPDAKVETIIFEVCKESKTSHAHTLVYPKDEIISAIDNSRMNHVGKKDWVDNFNIYASDKKLGILAKCEKGSKNLVDLADFALGITPYDKYRGHSEETIKNRSFHSKTKLNHTYKPLITGENITRYYLKPNVEEYIRYGDWLGAMREERFFIEPRILIRQIVSGNPPRIYACFTDEPYYFTQIGFSVLPKNPKNVTPQYLLAILNSTLMNFYHKFKFLDLEKNLFQKILIANCKVFPIKEIDLKQQKMFSDKVVSLQSENQKLNTTINDFLEWVQKRFPNLAVKKSMESWYLSDWKAFESELKKQKCQLLPKEQTEWASYFEKERHKALAIVKKLDSTDKEIDSLVYQLYGLTKEEIRIVEG